MGIFKKIIGFLKRDKKKEIFMHLDEETLKSDEIKKAQQEKIMSLESQIGRILSKEKEKRDKEKEKDKEQEVNKKLNEQSEDLKANKHGKIIKLSQFYKHYFNNKKFRAKLEICDKNDEVVLSKFGDFVILEGGKIGLIDKDGELMSYGKSLHHVLYKPDSFENQARRGRFLIPMDKDGNWIEDMDYKEMPLPINIQFDQDGKANKILWSKAKTSEVKKIIAGYLEKINYFMQELEMKEDVIIGLKGELDDIKRAKRIYESESHIAQSELSKSVSRFIESDKRLSEISSQVVKLTELKSIYENLLDRKDEIINMIMRKLELTGDSKLDRLRAELKDDLEFYKAILPEQVEKYIEPEKQTIAPVQPGEIIKK